MAGLRNRFSSLFDEEEDEITTVIKETDDDSPNTRTTTVKRAGEKGNTTKGRAPTKGNTLLNEMESIVREFGGYPNQKGIGTNGYEPRNFVENMFIQDPGEGVPSIPTDMDPGMGPGGAVGLAPGGQRGILGASQFPGNPNAAGAMAGPSPDPQIDINRMIPGGQPIDINRMIPGGSPQMDPGMGPGGAVGMPQPERIIDRLGEVNGGQRGMWGNTPFPGDPNAAGAMSGDPTGMRGMSPFPGNPNAAGAVAGDPSGMYGMSPFPGDPSNAGAVGQGVGMQGVSPFPGDPNAAGAVAGDQSGMYGMSQFPGDPSNAGAVAGASPQTSTSAFAPGGRGKEQVVNEEEVRVNDPNQNPRITNDWMTGGLTDPGSGPGGQVDSVMNPGMGPGGQDDAPQSTTRGAEKSVVEAAENEQDSYTVQGHQPTMAETDALARTWGKLAYDPKKRRDEYMKRLNKIYANTMALEALAIISGKPSRAGMYSKMAMGKLDAMQKFDSEDRLQQLTNSLYFNKNGEYAPPANKSEAHAALMQMGASLNEATAIVGHVPAAIKDDNKTYYRYDTKTNRVIARGAPSKMAPDGWGSNDWAQQEKQDNNIGADTATGTQVANAQYLAGQKALLNDMNPNSPGYKEQKEFVGILEGVLGQDVDKQKSFIEYYGTQIKSGDNPPKNPETGKKFGSWEEYAMWWKDPDNPNKKSFNGSIGNIPGANGVGAVTTAAQGTAMTEDEYLKARENGSLTVGQVLVVNGNTFKYNGG